MECKQVADPPYKCLLSITKVCMECKQACDPPYKCLLNFTKVCTNGHILPDNNFVGATMMRLSSFAL